MAVITDDFSTDPFAGGTPRWTNMRGTAVWDSTDFELDTDQLVGRNCVRYSAANVGSIELEAQVTFLAFNGGSQDVQGVAVRFESGGSEDFYYGSWDPTGGGNYVLKRVNGGGTTTLTTFTSAFVAAAGDWCTMRMAAVGAVSGNVVINMWFQNHGASKPADPGWIGSDGSPHQTFTDDGSAGGTRLNTATHIQCGIACGGSGSDVDTRHDFFKMRAISDRAGGGRVSKNTRTNYLGMGLGMNLWGDGY